MANRDIHIGFDMDGVLVDHTKWKVILARKMGYRLAAAQTPSETMRTLMPTEHWRRLQELLYSSDEYSLSASPMSGAVDLLAALRGAGIRYSLVSRRKSHDVARLLLEKLSLRPDHFSDDNTFFVERPEDKNPVCAHLGVTHYIDDEARVLKHLTSVPHRFLMDPHRATESSDYRVVRSLDEFARCIIT